EWLTDAGVHYTWEPRLGGRRRSLGKQSRHTGLRHEAFRAYADWMESPEFSAGLADLLELAKSHAPLEPGSAAGRTAVMCSESVWWRCHRRLITDHLVLIEQIEVQHLMHDGRLREPRLTPEARVEGETLVYDAGQEPLDLDSARR